MATFDQGMNLGMQAVQSGIARADRQRERDAMEARQARLDASAELDAEMNRRQKERLGQSIELDLQMKRQEAERLMKASSAFEKFTAASDLIDWSSDNAFEQYGAVTRSYLPDIALHPAELRKFEALDKANRQRNALVVRDTLRTSATQAMQEAARIAPELVIEAQQGKITPTEFAERLRERQKEIDKQAIELRRAPVEARMDAEASGAYGGRTPRKAELPPGAKAELDATADELRSINKMLNEGKLTPDRKLELVNRKSSLQRRLRAFDGGMESDGAQGPAAPAPKPESAPAGARQVGRFMVRPLD